MKRKKKIKIKKSSKGFTLIELLAVITLIAVLMFLAIPVVSTTIEKSRIKTSTKVADSYIDSMITDVNAGRYPFYKTNDVYAIPVECIEMEYVGKNPLGEWSQANEKYWAYVLVQFDKDKNKYTYGFTFRDSSNHGMYPTTSVNFETNKVKKKFTLAQPKTGLAIDFVSIENWDSFAINDTTKLVVLEAETQGIVGDNVNTCTLCNKGSNYDEIQKNKITIANQLIEKSLTDSSIYHHNGSNVNDANDGSYRYLGTDPNNYVCFGTDSADCSSNLYRIIGVFGDNIKLVKEKKVTNSRWNGEYNNRNSVEIDGVTYYNYWEYNGVKATLNEYLNNDFYNSLDTKWKNMIATHEWNIGGRVGRGTIKEFYINESSEKWSGKIGLITPSEFGYGYESSKWTLVLGDSSSFSGLTSYSWLRNDAEEWLMTRRTNTYEAYNLSGSRLYIGDCSEVYGNSHAIRPAFYLNKNIKLVSGNGTKLDPYRLEQN